jgi:hypothetical protein
MYKYLAISCLYLTSCYHHEVGYDGTIYNTSDIVYASENRGDAIIFTENGVLSGPMFEPPAVETRFTQQEGGIECVSIGPSDASSDYAVQYPLETGSRYSCNGTSFSVIMCMRQCKIALVRIDRPTGKPGLRNDHFLVDSCRGVIAFNVNSSGRTTDMSQRLRSVLGILHDTANEDCL